MNTTAGMFKNLSIVKDKGKTILVAGRGGP
jgi:hypothetical protein